MDDATRQRQIGAAQATQPEPRQASGQGPGHVVRAAVQRLILGERQLAILAVLHAAQEPLGFAAVHERLTAAALIAPSTTSTLLQRLSDQSLVVREGQPFQYRYRARAFSDAELLELLPRRYAEFLDVLWETGCVRYTVIRAALAARGIALAPTTITSTLSKLGRYSLVRHDPKAHTYAAALDREELIELLRATVSGQLVAARSDKALIILRERLQLVRQHQECVAAYDQAQDLFRATPNALSYERAKASMQELVGLTAALNQLQELDESRSWQLNRGIGARSTTIASEAGVLGEVAPEYVGTVLEALRLSSGIPAEALQEGLAALPTGGVTWQLRLARHDWWTLLLTERGKERQVGSFRDAALAARIQAATALLAHARLQLQISEQA